MGMKSGRGEEDIRKRFSDDYFPFVNLVVGLPPKIIPPNGRDAGKHTKQAHRPRSDGKKQRRALRKWKEIYVLDQKRNEWKGWGGGAKAKATATSLNEIKWIYSGTFRSHSSTLIRLHYDLNLTIWFPLSHKWIREMSSRAPSRGFLLG